MLDSQTIVDIPSLLKPQEVAKMLRISIAGVYRLTSERCLPFYKVKGGIRFDAKDVSNYLSNSRVESIRSNTNEYT